MAEVLGIITSLLTAGQVLESFAHQTRKWKRLSERLLDICEELYVAEIALHSWKRKFRIEKQPIRVEQRMLQVLFGKPGSEHITMLLGSIASLSKVVQREINKTISRPLQIHTVKLPLDGTQGDFDQRVVEKCLARIRENVSWSRKFALSVLGQADELERRINRLDHKIGRLERLSDLLLETEHPGIFEAMKRLPGRKVIPQVGSESAEQIAKRLQNLLTWPKYAELLHMALEPHNCLHIGLYVPQVDQKDFDFLIDHEGATHEIVARPVRFAKDRVIPRLTTSFEAAIPALRKQDTENIHVRPATASLEGFRASLPVMSQLVDLEYKDSLSIIIRDQKTNLGSQILYPQDQNAIASGIAIGSIRLIGSRWLNSLDCVNIRWRRTIPGGWTCMLMSTPGNIAITRELDKCLEMNSSQSGNRDLIKHVHIFRVGLVLAEIALKQPISYIEYVPFTRTMKLFLNSDEEINAVDVAALVDKKCNPFLGNMIMFCLGVLQNRDAMADRKIEDAYDRHVVKNAKELEHFMHRRGREP